MQTYSPKAGVTIRLRHLEKSINTYPADPELGRCFHWSAALCLDLKESDIVIGTVKAATLDEALSIPMATQERFIHAWVEVGDSVLAPTLIPLNGILSPMQRDFYYAENGIEDVRRLTRADLLKAFRGYNLIAHLTQGHRFRNDVSFVGHLLDQAGVEWTRNASGGAIPKAMP